MVSRPIHYNTRYKHDLTPRQRQVLDLVARGYTNSEIAITLDVSLDGAKWHVSEILAKLGVSTREQAAEYWRAYNRPLARVSRGLAGLTGLASGGLWKTVIGSAAVLGIAGVAIAAYAALRESGPGQGETVAGGGLAACVRDDFELRATFAGGGTDAVNIILQVKLARACTLPADMLLAIVDPATGQQPAIDGNPATVPVTTRDVLKGGEWVDYGLPVRWSNWCGGRFAFDAVASLGEFEARTALTAMPPCVAPGNPSTLRAATPPQPGGDTVQPGTVSEGNARKAAGQLAEAMSRGDVAAIASMARPTEYTCPAAATSDPYPVCDGTPDEQRKLGMISLPYASEASIYPIERFEQTLRQQISPSLRLKTIGCPANDAACTSFIAAFEFANAPGTGLFFAFEPWPDGSKTGIFAHGAIGPGMAAPLNGGSMKTILGETLFTVLETGEVTPVPTAPAASLPGEVSTAANELAALVGANDIAGLLDMSSPQTYTCPGTQAGGPGGPFPLCDGAAAGERRTGYRIALHGSEGETLSPSAFEAELRRTVVPAAKLVSIGCGDGKSCSAGFVVAFASGQQPAVFYFVLQYPVKGQPTIAGYGLSGDNAEEIIHGGPTWSWMGSTVFYPIK